MNGSIHRCVHNLMALLGSYGNRRLYMFEESVSWVYDVETYYLVPDPFLSLASVLSQCFLVAMNEQLFFTMP